MLFAFPSLLPTRSLQCACPLSRRSALLDGCTKRIAGAKSADPAIFTPLRLQCSLKSRGGAGDGFSSNGGGERCAGQEQTRKWAGGSAAAVRTTLSLRGEMIVPALGVRLTPVAAPALLHTALFQSLLTRGAEAKLQSG